MFFEKPPHPRPRQEQLQRPPRPEPNWERAADIRCLVGATGSGKSHQLRSWIRSHPGPVIVWDWKREYRELELAPTLSAFARRALHTRRLRYEPRYEDIEQQFEIFCEAAFTLQSWRPFTELLFVVEELQNVTRASWAPPAWARIVNEGRVYGFIVAGATTRPAYVDKTFVGNATYLRAGRLRYIEDAREVARGLQLRPELLLQLPDRAAHVYENGATRFEPAI